MLTALELENFKGIGERQRIEFRPLTLLFGPNSAGKSTILQALLYLHEVIVTGDADVGRTSLGGQSVDLGGFRRLVHGHDASQSMSLRAEFTTTGSLDLFGREPEDFPLPDLDDGLLDAWVELQVRWRATAGSAGPVVDRATIGGGNNREPLLWLALTETGPKGPRFPTMSARVNMGHPLVADVLEDARDAVSMWEECSQREDAFLPPGTRYGSGVGAGAGLGDGSGYGDGRRLPLFAIERTRLSALPSPSEPIRLVHDKLWVESAHVPDQVRTFLEMVVCGTLSQLVAVLRESLHIGPLRAIPARGRLHEGVGRSLSWSDGLGAWDALLASRSGLVERTNDWLRYLEAGCTISVQELQPVSSVEPTPSSSGSKSGVRSGSTSRSRSSARTASTPGAASLPLTEPVRRLLLLTDSGALVLPAELGSGISQIVPVIVAALRSDARLVMVEQPELHVHPALQVGLGDLFIDAIAESRDRRWFFIETHSEHLILRVLKRIRQTATGELPAERKGFMKEQLSVVYVDSVDGEVRIRRLQVDDDGEFVDAWPRGFFEERLAEVF